MRTTTWWRGLSGPAKFRFYTRVTLQVSIVSAVVAVAVPGIGVWPVVGVVVAGLATMLALEAQPELATWSAPTLDRRALTIAGITLAIVWVGCAVVVLVADAEKTTDGARATAACTTVLAALSLFSFSRHRWWIVAAASIVTGLVLGRPGVHMLVVAAVVLGLCVFVVGLMLLTVWGLHIMDDVEHTKDVEAELQIAEERLRFGRDLHDVVGRSFSAIAVKSELAATLARAGATDRAEAEMNEVKAIAVESMEEMRTLVRGYRDIDLAGEVAGARSLLSSSGCDLTVEGDPSAVPATLHEVAAWVVREGTTNIVRHSSARSATLTLGRAGMSLRNDGARGEVNERSGLLGLAERLAAHGATLGTSSDGDTFTLQITWAAA
jgi:two-component system sensor histidine kinase DesK